MKVYFKKKGNKRELFRIKNFLISFAYLENFNSVFYAFLINFKEAIYMVVEEYYLENTKVKFYDDYIVQNISNQKEYIDNVIINLIRKINPSLL